MRLPSSFFFHKNSDHLLPCFHQPTLVAVGAEEGLLRCYDLQSGKQTHEITGHKVRVKGLSTAVIPAQQADSDEEEKTESKLSCEELLPLQTA